MKVGHRLLGIPTNIGNDPIAVFVETFVIGQDRYDLQNMSQNPLIRLSDICDGWDVMFGDNEKMNGCLGIDVIECDTVFILMDDFCWNSAMCNFTK